MRVKVEYQEECQTMDASDGTMDGRRRRREKASEFKLRSTRGSTSPLSDHPLQPSHEELCLILVCRKSSELIQYRPLGLRVSWDQLGLRLPSSNRHLVRIFSFEEKETRRNPAWLQISAER
jgi:hypothetical protein